MPKIKINGCKYHYEMYGSGSETIVFSHGLLYNHQMFHKQIDYFQDVYRIMAYDHRGQGQSEVTKSGYDMDQLYEDAATLIKTLDLGQIHFAGLSMGGFVGMRLAARRPGLLKSLILMETSARPEPNKLKYSILSAIVKQFGTRPVTNRVMNILFGQKFLHDPARKQERENWKSYLMALPKSITHAVSGVIQRKGIEDELEKITCPTLILAGDQDVATRPEEAEFIHKNIPRSILKYIKGGGHTGCIEEPKQFNTEIEKFLVSIINS